MPATASLMQEHFLALSRLLGAFSDLDYSLQVCKTQLASSRKVEESAVLMGTFCCFKDTLR